ncbi:hypothetical protein PPACK8108_LOCUS7150 [Phakopsora pachyrhizi]|uniref:Lipoprotein n=2 Tax=Phakopsora pachyrhizi TaxID=170000 RepID=A0AAV0AU23_PHAPC|nr:hypothetical protein PPACK8108_LOCUS7150 [Phakopsora pachyrhizi]
MNRIRIAIVLASLSLANCQFLFGDPAADAQNSSTNQANSTGSKLSPTQSSDQTVPLTYSSNSSDTNSLNSANGTATNSSILTGGTNAFDNTGSNSSIKTNSSSLFNGTATNSSIQSTGLIGSYNGTISPSKNTSMFSEVYTLDYSIKWDESDFNVYGQNGKVEYTISNKVEGVNMSKKEFVVKEATDGQAKVRIDANNKFCGFGKTYTSDDGASFTIDPRMFLPDRWFIRQSNVTYVFKRFAMSLNGDILDVENKRLVAQVKVDKANTTSEEKKKKMIILNSDGSISGWDLVAFIAVVRNRIRQCGY